MAVVSGIVLYAVIWFVVLFCVLPLRLTTQDEAGEVVPGTHKSAPADPQLRKKAVIVTLVSAVIWAIVTTIILMEWITVEDLDFNNILPSSDES